MITGNYEQMTGALTMQRRRMLQTVGRLSVYCLACGAAFTIQDLTEDVLYCTSDHKKRHSKSCGDGTISIMDFGLKEKGKECITGN